MNTRKAIFTGLLLTLLMGCEDSDARYEAGYSDGYAVGYNTACQIRATLVEGDWDDRDYSRGYSEGQTAGIIGCNSSKNK